MSTVCYCGQSDCPVTTWEHDACVANLRAERNAWMDRAEKAADALVESQTNGAQEALARKAAEARAKELEAQVLSREEALAEARFRIAELEGRRFPVLDAGFSVPWALVAPFEAQAQRNHSQTLQRLAERGGLDPVELWAIMHGIGWGDRSKLPTQEAAKAWALSLLAKHSEGK